MNRADAEDFTRRWAQAVATGGDDAWNALITDDVQDLSGGQTQRGRDSFEQRTKLVRSAFDRVSVRVDDLVVEGDRLAWRWTFEGTHTGPFAGVAPTHKQVALRGVNVQTLREGKVVEHWTLADLAGALRQLGG